MDHGLASVNVRLNLREVRNVGIQLAKQSIDLAILVRDTEASLAFYRDLLGFRHDGDFPLSMGPSGRQQLLWCGDSLVKLVRLDNIPAQSGAGGIDNATGRGSAPVFRIAVARVWPRRRSMTRNGVPSWRLPKSSIRQMFGWHRPSDTHASCSKRWRLVESPPRRSVLTAGFAILIATC